MILLRNRDEQQNSVPSSAGPRKGAHTSELQDHYGMTPEPWKCVLYSVSIIAANKLSLQELHQLIGF